MTDSRTPLTLIGLGPMGQGMVKLWLAAGHAVTVWNRTRSRADDVLAAGAVWAERADAVAANRLIVLSLTDYRAADAVLDGLDLTGKVVVNLSSDTPDRTREAAEAVAARGGTLLVGGLMVPAPLLGTEAAYAFYSGPEDVFAEYRDTLALLGRTDYLGADPVPAQLHYQAQLDLFLTVLAGMLHAFALVGTAGVSAKDFAPYMRETLDTMSFYLDETVTSVDSGQHPGDLANITMMGATTDHIVAASEDAGLDAGLPKAVQDLYHRAIAAGRGGENWTALVDLIRR
ncbi:NAD(P)-binding domain-containing protein [Saccharothrix violaceirubra]|uniref:3-hydroxyisobutyrate dehydrogenase-like beta-hydroxyacid dehydrogenase n=1 Tax=Saccharothrix violaceirubra TaxID=413306 RepID=A0A7W7SYD7_9PSEU|nr:NAD(P)-binding domain-containing protein [Saccharothrix violaceirubra]MBB4962951.1 3-hydroxyisobutyrate dehydrogenase-like beta-hydroxyacid dehydrogenase [Saccharothrix violaceirubra]